MINHDLACGLLYFAKVATSVATSSPPGFRRIGERPSMRLNTEAQQVGEIGHHIREAISHTRKLAHGLSPVELETNGFMSALQELAAHFQELFRVECRLDCPKPVLIRNNIFATHLYRIVGSYFRNPANRDAEIAITVHDDFPQCGIGTFLAQTLLKIAKENGMAAFTAHILASNPAMMRVFRKVADKWKSNRNRKFFRFGLNWPKNVNKKWKSMTRLRKVFLLVYC